MYDGIIIKAGTTELTEQDAIRIYEMDAKTINNLIGKEILIA